MIDADKKKMITTVCIGICLFISALNWMLMKFGGIAGMVSMDFDLHNFRWIVSAYLIAEVTMIPITGKLIDRYGEKHIIAFGAIIFVLGAVFGGCARTTVDLIMFRVIQGVGAGMIFSIAFSYVGRAYKNHERNMAHEIMTAAFAVGSLFGTMVGYWAVMNWKWTYMMFLSAAAMAVCGFIAYKLLPEHDVVPEADRKVDIPGLVYIGIFMLSVMYYTQIVNREFPLVSGESLMWFLWFGFLAVTIYLVERKADNPAFPVHMTKNHAKAIIAMIVVCLAGIGLIQYLTKMFLLYYGMNIYEASYMFFWLLGGGAVTSIVGCRKVTQWGLRFWVTLGAMLLVIAFLLMGFIGDKGVWHIRFCMFMMGLGFGCMVTELLCGMQGFTKKSEMGVSSSTIMGLRMAAIAIGNVFFANIILSGVKEQARSIFNEVPMQDPLEFTYYVAFYAPELYETVVNSFDRGVLECAILGAIIFAGLALFGLWFKRDDLDAAEALPDNKE